MAGGSAWKRGTVALISAIALLALSVLAAIYGLSERRLQRTYDDVAAAPLRAVGTGDIAEGARLVSVLGCTSCHGKALTGEDFYGVSAPNLTRVVREYDAARFARLLRRGVRNNGTSVTWDMPSDFFAGLADDQVAAIYAFLTSRPQRQDTVADRHFGIAKRLALLTGDTLLSADVSRGELPPTIAPKPDEAGFGAYLARAGCSECHGFDLRGGAGTPSLAVVAKSYSPEAFAHFLKTGTSVGGVSDLPMMSGVARERLKYLYADEVSALHAYLTGLPDA